MASSGGQEFFQVGEIRPARDSDFEYFKSLAREDVKHGWKKKFDKNGLRVWNKDVGKSTAKMVKVRYTSTLSDPSRAHSSSSLL